MEVFAGIAWGLLSALIGFRVEDRRPPVLIRMVVVGTLVVLTLVFTEALPDEGRFFGCWLAAMIVAAVVRRLARRRRPRHPDGTSPATRSSRNASP
jgi:hypothetical protein